MINIYYCDDVELLSFARQEAIDATPKHQTKTINYQDVGNNIISQICQTDLFDDTQKCIVYNATFLLSDEPNELLLSEKILAIEHTKANLFVVAKTAEDFNKVITKEKTKCVFKKIVKFNETKKRSMVQAMLKQSNIDIDNEESFALLLNLLDNNPFTVKSEVEKLIIAAQPQNISHNLIENIINSSNEKNIFKMITFLLSNNKRELIKLYDDLISIKYQPTELLQIMSGQIYNLKLLKCAFLNRWDSSTIEQTLGIKKFVQETNRHVLNKISIEYFDELINRFTMLDYNIKRSLVNPYHGLKLALIK